MSQLFYWPGKYYLYAIGNTSAVCLTRNLPPEEDADILLLGCGDPRHVLYTIYSQQEKSSRSLDFTCVDYEPAVLARNMLLFTLIADDVPVSTIWNIFYHMYLDTESHAVLIAQCKKLVERSHNMEAWRASPYSAYLRVSTEYTLMEIRRHWSLYISMPELPSKRQKAIRQAFEAIFKEQRRPSTAGAVSWSSARSAGPLLFEAGDTWSRQPDNHVRNFRNTGTTFFQSKDVSAAKFPNPTLAYSLVGEGCALHYATDPIMGFHLAAVFGNSEAAVAPVDVVQAARKQFSEWCAASRMAVADSATAPRIRFFLADAIAASRALRAYGSTRTLKLGVPVAQFCTQLIHLDGEEYTSGRAPTSFNVIETSNLIDYIGLLNVLISSASLLSRSPSSVLYTESLLFQGKDATKEFAALLHADIGTMALILDLCPTDYLSGFTTRSNTHELSMYYSETKKQRRDTVPSQYHQVTTWKSPSSCDSVLALRGGRPSLSPIFDTRQLGTLLFDMYHSLFRQEDARTFLAENKDNLARAVGMANILHYNRETFVFLLKLVRERLHIPASEWLQVMGRFQELEWEDTTMPMNTINRNDLYANLHRQNVYTVLAYSSPPQRIGRFADWDVVPPVVRVVLSVPREKIVAFERLGGGTPVVQCHVRGVRSMNAFSAIHLAYGRALAIGTKRSPRVRFEQDPQGRHGTFPLVVSFVMSAYLLSDIESPEGIKVSLSVRSTTGTNELVRKMGMELEIFGAKLMDEGHVHVLPEPQLSPAVLATPTGSSISSPNATTISNIGRQGAVVVELDEQNELVSSLSARVDITDADVVREFGSGAIPTISQTSPCAMRLTVADRVHDVIFPFPVIGSQQKLRLARKSRYIEVVVPTSGPFLKPDGMKLNPFPVVGDGKALVPWNIHRIVLSRLPVLALRGSQLDPWLNVHVGSMLSARERKMRKKQKADALLFVKDTLHFITVYSAGTQQESQVKVPVRVFALRDETTNNCDTIFFISDLRFDVSSHTVVCDGYVLPLTHNIMLKIASFFGLLVGSGTMVDVRVFEGEMEAWKQLIPAFVERCRTWEHTDNCEYLTRQEVPLTQEMESDPLCSCGRGKDVDGLLKVPEWRRYAPFVTRIALSPLFAVSYLETVGRDPSAHKCSVCRGKGKPKIMACSKCQKVRYCSAACQKKDWPRHKPTCKA
ncbi:hypothetical protein K466DRAFT_491419 [Polyporus arcularius HHB13444]|uniref:MYND-type domain-containing protein n=1 Tax=Polyporus arcularius HHB13444 TaxID=1314778 RepID=A0A5C3PDW1_9APHY|nr:hypothetical protein K466DRAFT_491419 [Polyporus arcularius HHB13444]